MIGQASAHSEQHNIQNEGGLLLGSDIKPIFGEGIVVQLTVLLVLR